MGRVFKENPLKSAQTRSKNISPLNTITPISRTRHRGPGTRRIIELSSVDSSNRAPALEPSFVTLQTVFS